MEHSCACKGNCQNINEWIICEHYSPEKCKCGCSNGKFDYFLDLLKKIIQAYDDKDIELVEKLLNEASEKIIENEVYNFFRLGYN